MTGGFRTKHELALELCRQVNRTLRALGSKAGFIVVFDGAYAAQTLVRSLIAAGAIVVTRLRRDATLFDLLVTKTGQRGWSCKYSKNRISLKKRAADSRSWQTIRYCSRRDDRAPLQNVSGQQLYCWRDRASGLA